MRIINNLLGGILLTVIVCVFWGCSSTKNIPEDDKLFVGLKKIEYKNYEKDEHIADVKEELEAALATPPNGALLGSSFYRSPFPIGLWVWNAFSKSDSPIGKFLLKTFGKRPVLMSWVNPELRASVGTQVLKAHGYFQGFVDYDVVNLKKAKEAKISYTVNFNRLYRIDTLQYVNFPAVADTLIREHLSEAKIKKGDAFQLANLDAERIRLSNLFRNNGYYFYQPDYSIYLADTMAIPGKVGLKLRMVDNIPHQAQKKWYIGKVNLMFRKQPMSSLRDSIKRRNFTVYYTGRKPPIRSRVVLRELKIKPGQLYSYDNYIESANKLNSSGLFSLVDFKFSPRDTTRQCDTLDLMMNCVFDKKYDFYVESNMTGKTSGYIGPGLVLGFTKRNAFRGGELLDINLRGSYEWQTAHGSDGERSKINSYEYGGDASLKFPRFLLPFFSHHRFYSTPLTTLKASTNIINRASFFKRHVVSGELTYKFQTSANSTHELSPLVFQFEYMRSFTDKFADIMSKSPYLSIAMQDQFVPKLRYSYTYTSDANKRNPIRWQTTVSESGNILSLGYVAAGKKWGEVGKVMFKNPYAQFVKIETDLVKSWNLFEHGLLVGHINAGVIWTYGNSHAAPYTEQFYVGGANSIRAFNVRTIGPGAYRAKDAFLSYMDQTGDIKLLANLEFRPRLFGNLYGAMFLDAGNVWTQHTAYRPNSKFEFKNILKESALGTGIGLRYDLDFLVIRIDWGIGLHVPYKPGFYNVGKFKDSQSIHFAVGYPF